VIPEWVTCQEFVEFLADYLDGALPPAKKEEFDYHLSSCPSCVAFLKNYREAMKAGKAALTPSAEPVVEPIPEELVRAILAARKKSS
jgi:anti-sigma factor RsiW